MKRRVLLPLFLILVAVSSLAQQHDNVALGFKPDRMYQFGEIDHVNLFNGNLVVNVPIGLSYRVDESFSLQFGLTYNSKIWEYISKKDEDEQASSHPRAFPNFGSNAGIGWRFSLGRLKPSSDIDTAPSSDPDHPRGWTYESAAGDIHEFAGGNPGMPEDSSYLRLRTFGSPVTEAYVDFPNGEVHKFEHSLADDRWHLTSITSALGRTVNISYTFSGSKVTSWTINDFVAGRTHHVYFKESAMTDTDQYGQIVDRVEFQTVGGVTPLIYDFVYDEGATLHHGCEQTWTFQESPGHPLPDTVPAALLRSISARGIAGTTWAFDYVPGSGGCANGVLQKVTLPTLGTYEYTYDSWNFPHAPTCDLDVDLTIDHTPAVTMRRVNGAEWHYFHDMAPYSAVPGPVPWCTQCPDGGTTCSPRPPLPPTRWVRTSVLNPRGDRADYYFSGWLMNSPYHDGADLGADSSEYALPFTRGKYVGSTEQAATDDGLVTGRFLSTQTFTGCATQIDTNGDCCDASGALNGICRVKLTPKLVKSTFVRYEHDGALASLRPRVKSERTRYDDDCDANGANCKVADIDRDDFDGYGHYRLETASGNFAGLAGMTTFTNYNPSGPPSSVWNLGNYTEQYRRPVGSTVKNFRTLSCFEPNGFLKTKRIFADPDGNECASAQTCNDVVFHWDAPTSTGATRTITEKTFGGDSQHTSLPSDSTLCSVTQFSGAEFTAEWTFDSGVLVKQVPLKTGSAMFSGIDRVTDASTGLVTTSKDTSGVATNYTYDSIGRLSSIVPPTGIAGLGYTYDAATASAPATVHETSTSLVGPKKKYEFDPLGRILREKTFVPNDGAGIWSVRAMAYDGMGWKTSVSEPYDESSGPVAAATFAGYDAFGRAHTITAPDRSVTSVAFKMKTVNNVPTIDPSATGGVSKSWRTVKVATSPSSPDTEATTEETYDRFGRLVRVKDAHGVHTAYKYDVAGNLTNVCVNAGATGEAQPCSGQLRTFTYDGRGVLTSETHPENGTFYYKYDSAGHVVEKSRTDTTDFNLTYVYDEAGRLQDVKTGTLLLKHFDFATANSDGQKNLGKMTAATRHNRLTDPARGGVDDYVVTERFEYDLMGRLDTKTTQIANPINSTTKSVTQSIVYNDLSLPGTIKYPVCEDGCGGTQLEITGEYDGGLLRRIKEGTTNLGKVDYAPSGAVSAVTHYNATGYGTVVDQYHLDAMGRPTSIDFGSFQCNAPTITTQPSGAGWVSGSLTLQVATGNQQPLAFQWYDALTLVPFANATSSTFTITPPAEGGQYFVRVSNPCGHVDSEIVKVGNPACNGPVIVTQPAASQTFVSGQTTYLNVSLEVTAGATFQWYSSTDNGYRWTESAPGGTGATLSITSLTATTWFKVTVAKCGKEVTSNQVVVNVPPPSTPIAAPQWVEAHAISSTSVVVSWAPVTGADSYDVYQRRSITSPTYLGRVDNDVFNCNAAVCSFTDNSQAEAGQTYLYGVHANSQQGGYSAMVYDLATTIMFTPIDTDTVVSTAQFDQLLTALNGMRDLGYSPAVQWSTILSPPGAAQPQAPASNVSVLAEHILALRREMDAALVRLGFTPGTGSWPAYTDSSLVGVPLKTTHILELQQRAK